MVKGFNSGWIQAMTACEQMERGSGVKTDTLMNDVRNLLSTEEARRCQFLFFGAVRHWQLLDAALAARLRKRPRPGLAALLRIAGAEMLASGAAGLVFDGYPLSMGEPDAAILPKIVDHAVRYARQVYSEAESKLVNAVLRRLPETLAELSRDEVLAYSHPRWLVERWRKQFGQDETTRLLAHNQSEAPLFLQWLREDPAPEFLQPVEIYGEPPRFFRLSPAAPWAQVRALLDAGDAYVQDPATRLAPDLLAVQPGERVLDLCAAPGGKSIYLLRALGDDESGLLLAVDRPGSRLEKLDENFRKQASESGPELRLLALDLEELDPAEVGVFDAVLIDVPCSNSGVIRRRPDVKLRLDPGEPARQAPEQEKLLHLATRFVAPEGRLVYSTCSIEPEENAGVVEAFLREHVEFELAAASRSLPQETGFDGAGAFLLRHR